VNPARKVAVTAKLLLEAPLSASFWSPTQAHEPAMHRAFSALLTSDVSANILHGH
jgi:hypothetical protein